MEILTAGFMLFGVLMVLGIIGLIVYGFSMFIMGTIKHEKDPAQFGASLAVALMALLGLAIIVYMWFGFFIH